MATKKTIQQILVTHPDVPMSFLLDPSVVPDWAARGFQEITEQPADV